MEDIVPDEVRAQYERMHDAMVPLLQQHSVLIAAQYNGELRQHATGTLMQFSDYYFLVTAAHAIEKFHEGKEFYPDLQLLIDNGNNLVPVYGTYRVTQTVRDPKKTTIRLPEERDDLWDIGLWELHPQTVKALTSKRFLNRRNISITADLTTGVYFLAGGPCEWSEADMVSRTLNWKWFRYITHPYPEREQLHHFDDGFHMALCLGEDPQLPKKLQGISGCTIWKLSDLPVKEDWSADQAKVVAIQTGIDSNGVYRAIRGTNWQCVLPILGEMHPDIREGFKLWLPGPE